MARVYMITEEEMQSLIDSLEMHKLRQSNTLGKRPEGTSVDDMHRAFHFTVVRWAQEMGFRGHRAF